MKFETKEIISHLFYYILIVLIFILIAWHIINLAEIIKEAAVNCNCTWIG